MNSPKSSVFILWILIGLALLGSAVFFSGRGSDQGGGIAGVFLKTFGDIGEGTSREKLAAVIDLAEPRAEDAGEGRGLLLKGDALESASAAAKSPQSPDKKEAQKRAASGTASETSPLPAPPPPPTGGSLPPPPPAACNFENPGSADHKMFFSEIAWMGTLESASNEWMEIKNNGGGNLDLDGWQIFDEDGDIKIIFGKENLGPGELLLLERSDDNSVSGVAADKIYIGSLANAGTRLKMFGKNCSLADEVDARSGWPGGDNELKKTLERKSDLTWQTSAETGGTPKAKNSEAALVTVFPPPAPPVPSPSPPAPPPSPPPPPASVGASYPLITEIMAGSEGNAANEFIELYNPTPNPIDLTGWSVKKRSSTGNESSLLASSRLQGKIIFPGKYFLAANEEGYAGSVPPDAAWAKSNTLAYTENAVMLYDQGGAKVEEVSWTEIPKGQSFARASLASNAFAISAVPSPQNSVSASP